MRYLAIKTIDGKNMLLGEVQESDVETYTKMQGINIVSFESNEHLAEIEKQFQPIPTAKNSLSKTTISKPNPNYNYSLIPKKAIKAIQEAYNAKNYALLHEYREKYKVASKCPTCQNIDNWCYGVWSAYFNQLKNKN